MRFGSKAVDNRVKIIMTKTLRLYPKMEISIKKSLDFVLFFRIQRIEFPRDRIVIQSCKYLKKEELLKRVLMEEDRLDM